MKTVTFHSHTADIRMKVEASSLSQLFTAALEGMNSVLKEDACRENMADQIQTFDLHVRSVDATALLIDFLSDVLTETLSSHRIFCRAEFHLLTGNELNVTLYGSDIEEFDEDIKAVTYHEADVRKNDEGNWETYVIFDI